MKNNYQFLFIICLTTLGLHSQEVIYETYEINPYSDIHPLWILDEAETLTPKYKNPDGAIVNEISKTKNQVMRYRAKCFALSKNLKDNHSDVIFLKNEIQKLITAKEQLVSLDYRNTKSIRVSNLAAFRDSVKTEEDILKNEIENREKSIKNYPCPKGFSSIQGNLKYSGGYLLFTPLKYTKVGSGEDGVDRVKEFLNGYTPNNKQELGFKLNSEKSILFRNKSVSFGALTIPFKMYLSSKSDSIAKGTNNIVTDINVSLFVGKNWGYHGYDGKGEIVSKRFHSINFLLGAGKLTLKKNNTDGQVTNDTDILNVNIGVAYSFSFNKFNVFAGLGVDIPTKGIGSKWIFHGSPWVGFGLGYSLFKS